MEIREIRLFNAKCKKNSQKLNWVKKGFFNFEMRVSKIKQRFLDFFLLHERNAFDVFELWLLPEKILKFIY